MMLESEYVVMESSFADIILKDLKRNMLVVVEHNDISRRLSNGDKIRASLYSPFEPTILWFFNEVKEIDRNKKSENKR